MVSGEVEHFALIRPPRVRLSGAPGAAIQVEVVVIPNERYPFEITAITVKDGRNVSVETLEPAVSERPSYRIRVTNRSTNAGRYFDVITLHTDSGSQPQLQIGIVGDIKDPP
jgi:hypothetical protein